MTSQDYTLDIVSPQFPCGAAWLANALLELEVPLGHLWGFDTRKEWAIRSDNSARYVASDLPWKQTLASLQLGRVFRFSNNIRPRFTHAFPWQIDLCRRVVLIVRDPRDALYSEWRRHLDNTTLSKSTSFVEFIQQPFYDGPISRIDFLCLYLRSWLAIRSSQPGRIYLLRFEDWKQQPLEQLRAVTRWMGLHVSDDALTRAVEASDVRHLQAVETTLRKRYPFARQFNRLGQPNEWRCKWPKAWQASFGEHWQSTLAEMNYSLLQAPGSVSPNFDLKKVLTWRDLHSPALQQYWSTMLEDVSGHDSPEPSTLPSGSKSNPVNPHAPPSLSPVALIRTIWRHRQLMAQLTWREITQRHRGSVLGLLWALLNPLLSLAVYTVVFSVVFKARWGSTQESKTVFAIVLFVGLSLHTLFADIVGRAPGLIMANTNYVKRVIFPLEILPIVNAGAALFYYSTSMLMLLTAQSWLNGGLPLTCLLLPLVTMPLVLLALGLAWFVASLGVFLRDIGPLVTLLVMLLMFLSPVFYSMEAFPTAFHPLLLANPLTFVIEQARAVVIWGQQPNWPGLAIYTAAAILFASAGYAWFQSTRKGFADVL